MTKTYIAWEPGSTEGWTKEEREAYEKACEGYTSGVGEDRIKEIELERELAVLQGCQPTYGDQPIVRTGQGEYQHDWTPETEGDDAPSGAVIGWIIGMMIVASLVVIAAFAIGGAA